LKVGDWYYGGETNAYIAFDHITKIESDSAGTTLVFYTSMIVREGRVDYEKENWPLKTYETSEIINDNFKKAIRILFGDEDVT
jgi:hypothetical protein